MSASSRRVAGVDRARVGIVARAASVRADARRTSVGGAGIGVVAIQGRSTVACAVGADVPQSTGVAVIAGVGVVGDPAGSRGLIAGLRSAGIGVGAGRGSIAVAQRADVPRRASIVVVAREGGESERPHAGPPDALVERARVAVAFPGTGGNAVYTAAERSGKPGTADEVGARGVGRAEAVIGDMVAELESSVAGVARAPERICAGIRPAAEAIASAAGVSDRAQVPVVARPAGRRPDAPSRGRIAGIACAGVPVVAVTGGMHALARARIAAVRRARIVVVAIRLRSLADGRPAGSTGDARVVGRADALVIAGVAQGRGSPDAITAQITEIRGSAGVSVIAALSGWQGSPGADDRAARSLAGVGLGAGIAVVAKGSGRHGAMRAAAIRGNDGASKALIERARIVIVAVARLVPAGPRGGVARIDGAEVEVLARGAGDFRRGGLPWCDRSCSEGKERNGGQREETENGELHPGFHGGTSGGVSTVHWGVARKLHPGVRASQDPRPSKIGNGWMGNQDARRAHKVRCTEKKVRRPGIK